MAAEIERRTRCKHVVAAVIAAVIGIVPAPTARAESVSLECRITGYDPDRMELALRKIIYLDYANHTVTMARWSEPEKLNGPMPAQFSEQVIAWIERYESKNIDWSLSRKSGELTETHDSGVVFSYSCSASNSSPPKF